MLRFTRRSAAKLSHRKTDAGPAKHLFATAETEVRTLVAKASGGKLDSESIGDTRSRPSVPHAQALAHI